MGCASSVKLILGSRGSRAQRHISQKKGRKTVGGGQLLLSLLGQVTLQSRGTLSISLPRHVRCHRLAEPMYAVESSCPFETACPRQVWCRRLSEPLLVWSNCKDAPPPPPFRKHSSEHSWSTRQVIAGTICTFCELLEDVSISGSTWWALQDARRR